MKLRTSNRSSRGQVTIFVEENGKRRMAFRDHNLVVNGGRQILSQLLGGVNTAAITTIQVGQQGFTGGNILTPATPVVTQTALNDNSPVVKTQQGGSPVMTYSLPQVTAQFIFTMETTEGNSSSGPPYVYTEAGLFTSSGVMYAVENFPGLVKTSARRFIFEWLIMF